MKNERRPFGIPGADLPPDQHEHRRLSRGALSGEADVPTEPEQAAITAGRTLATLRHLRGLSQRQLAERSGLNKTAISDYETGKRAIPEPRRQRILAALGLPLRAWDDTVRHVEWLNWLAGEGSGEPGNRRHEIQRIAETAGRDLERHLGDLLGVLAGSGQ